MSLQPPLHPDAPSYKYETEEYFSTSSSPSEVEHWPVPMPPPTAPHLVDQIRPSNPRGLSGQNTSKSPQKLKNCFLFLVVVLVAIAVIAIVEVVKARQKADISNVLPTAFPPTGAPQPPFTGPSQSQTASTLDVIRERRSMRCGVADQVGFSSLANGERVGFEIDLCRAVGAAVFGNGSFVEYVVLGNAERFDMLQSGQVDVMAAGTTYTMQRDVFEPSTKTGFTFSTPYIYGGLGFAGLPEFVACAEALNTTGNCTGVKICVLDGTTHVGIVEGLFPSFAGLVLAPATQDLYRDFVQGSCNVLAGEQFDVPEVLVRQAGYTGNFSVGGRLFSKEPLAMVTRDGDAKWSVFVDWVVLALLTAEDQKVTQSIASTIVENPVTLVDPSQSMFIDAVAAVGNYAEMYERHLAPLVPRAGVNLLNNGSSPLISSFPFGNISIDGPGPRSGGTLEAIANRGFLRCGVAVNNFFAVYNYTTQQWTGLDTDFCRAVAAALFGGIDNTIFVPVTAAERFERLQSGDIDLLSRETSATYERETREPTTKQEFSFSKPVFYTGVQFGGIPRFVDCAESLDVTSGNCKELLICVNNGTTTIDRVRQLLPERYIIEKATEQLVAECLATGTANVIAGIGFDTANITIRQFYTGPYKEGSKFFSKESLALVTRQDDPQWTSFINWVVCATFYAEEEGISQATYNLMPEVNLFGPSYASMFKDVIRAVGSYGYIYMRSAASRYPRTILNLLNTAPYGPEQYPLPGLLL